MYSDDCFGYHFGCSYNFGCNWKVNDNNVDYIFGMIENHFDNNKIDDRFTNNFHNNKNNNIQILPLLALAPAGVSTDSALISSLTNFVNNVILTTVKAR